MCHTAATNCQVHHTGVCHTAATPARCIKLECATLPQLARCTSRECAAMPPHPTWCTTQECGILPPYLPGAPHVIVPHCRHTRQMHHTEMCHTAKAPCHLHYRGVAALPPHPVRCTTREYAALPPHLPGEPHNGVPHNCCTPADAPHGSVPHCLTGKDIKARLRHTRPYSVT